MGRQFRYCINDIADDEKDEDNWSWREPFPVIRNNYLLPERQTVQKQQLINLIKDLCDRLVQRLNNPACYDYEPYVDIDHYTQAIQALLKFIVGWVKVNSYIWAIHKDKYIKLMYIS